LTGPSSSTGKDNQDGFNLYLKSINNTVAGRKIEAMFADDQNQADVGLTKTKALVENQGAQIVAGLVATPTCYAVAAYAKQAQIPAVVTGQCSAQGLTIDPKTVSPYLTRFTSTSVLTNDPAADWAYNKSYRKGILLVADYGGGLELADAFASTFVKHGGAIVQELYPAIGTSDFGPYLAQFNQDADFILEFVPGTSALRFGQQYSDYTSKPKPIIDSYGLMTTSDNLTQLGDKAVGIVGVDVYSTAFDSPQNKAFLTAFGDAYPNRPMSGVLAQGYAGAQVIEGALKKVNGTIDDKQKFLDALYSTNIDTVKGPVKLDNNHDVVENVYIYQIAKEGGKYVQKLLQTYNGASSTWDRTPDEVAHFPFGQLKNKWVSMTKDKLATYIK